MTDLPSVKTPAKRRRYTKAFKAQILAKCVEPGASVAGVAIAHGLNPNLVQKWRYVARNKSEQPVADFLPVSLTQNQSPQTATSVIFELRDIKVHWPISHIQESVAWLRALR